ncbi:alanine--tRNA ligase [Oxyplasma meridianum]|uniref:Alanine--tRNA ligase n=1 Tax=Oxyplasma meridianum TaxID=3073602 RepID=A0AAX4NFA3_9ARCH
MIDNPDLDLNYFHKSGFTRKICASCGKAFWTLDGERTTCGDPPCDSYTFIGNSPVYKPFSLNEMRDEFVGFFKNTHKVIMPYPVVPRWRDDVLLVNASIYDFQPHVTSGRVKPPGNPLVMSQPSIRMTDTDLVGSTGRHLTSFEMLCHDAFNYGDKVVYWKEETIEYCFAFLTERLRINPILITFKEKPWFGGGNAGNAFEVFVMGLEVATLVFMDLKEDNNGDVDIEGTKYSKMELSVVDTGYGLERLTWLSQGTSTVYDSTFRLVIDYIIQHSSRGVLDEKVQGEMSSIAAKIDPFKKAIVLKEFFKKEGIETTEKQSDIAVSFENSRSVFALADHTKTLLLLFSDYVIPSNVKVGYLARTLLRRSFRYIEDLKFTGSVETLIKMHYELLGGVVREYPEKFISEMIHSEYEKYKEMSEKGKNLILRTFDRKKSIDVEDLVTLYDSNGLVPSFVEEVLLKDRGYKVDIPEDFQSQVILRHEKLEKSRARKIKTEEFPQIETRPLYYDDANIGEFNALVMYSGDKTIITNQTAFYPEGGGQPFDLGYFTYGNKKIAVINVRRVGKSIVHYLAENIPVKAKISGHVDMKRRKQLMIHHSATHLLLGVARQTLGQHVWQNGVQKEVERSRIDITHYRKISENEIREIEEKCLQVIIENRRIKAAVLDWNSALEKYGFRLFEGGIPESSKLRVVEIEGIDAEGCGGTHLDYTGQIGFIKIISAEPLQEGIQRIIFAAGYSALGFVQEMQSRMENIRNELNVDLDHLDSKFKASWEEYISLRKKWDKAMKETVKNMMDTSMRFIVDGISVHLLDGTFSQDQITEFTRMANSSKNSLFLINNHRGSFIEVTVISTSLKGSDSIVKALSQPAASYSSGSQRYARFNSTVRIDETLIRKVLATVKNQ